MKYLFLTTVTALAAFAFHPTAFCAETACDRSDPGFICGVEDAEDLVRLPGTPWVIASQLNLDLDSGSPPVPAGLGPLNVINIDTHEVVRLFPTPESAVEWDRKTYPHCPAPPQTPTSHGLNVRPLGGNKFQVYFVNHGGRQSVEVVDVVVGTDGLRATWRGCIPVPRELGIWPNSVAPLPGGGLILSGDRMATWRPGGVWERFDRYQPYKPDERGFANGVEVSRDGRSIFVAEPEIHVVTRMSIDGTAPSVSLNLNFSPDNLRWGEDGYLYVAGPNPPKDFPVKKCLLAPLCDMEFVVARIDPKAFTAREIFRGGDGMKGKFGAATAALQVGKQIWLGTVHGNRIAVLPQVMSK